MERESDGRYRCLTCGKFTKNRGHMQEHIEVHIEGLNFPCPQCDKSFRGRGGLRKHVRNLHYWDQVDISTHSPAGVN